jgi:hypothetical protein
LPLPVRVECEKKVLFLIGKEVIYQCSIDCRYYLEWNYITRWSHTQTSKNWKAVVVTYLNVVPQHSLVRTKESHETLNIAVHHPIFEMDISLIVTGYRQCEQPRSILAHPITVSIPSLLCPVFLPFHLFNPSVLGHRSLYPAFSSIILLDSWIQF